MPDDMPTGLETESSRPASWFRRLSRATVSLKFADRFNNLILVGFGTATIGFLVGCVVTSLNPPQRELSGEWRLPPPPLLEPAGSTSGEIAPLPELHPVARAPIQPARPAALPEVSKVRTCDGDEMVCAIVTTGNPVETLAKLGAAVPPDAQGKYRLWLSIERLDDPQ